MIDQDAVREALTGPVTSISVPFFQDGGIDYASLRRCLDFSIANGSKAMILTNGDSLYSLLSDQEIAEVTKVVVEQTARRALVVAADRQWGTPQEAEFARFCRQTGADLLMVLPPNWVNSCTLASLVDHYSEIAKHCPVMLVTNLFRDFPLAQSLSLMEMVRDRVEGVVAVKDDLAGEFARGMAMRVYDKWAVISAGHKGNFLDLRAYGCDGYFSTFSRFHPTIGHQFWAAVKAEDWTTAHSFIRNHDMPFFEIIKAQPGGYDAAIHAALELAGLAQRWRRKPYYSLNDAEMEVLAGEFKSRGWL